MFKFVVAVALFALCCDIALALSEEEKHRAGEKFVEAGKTCAKDYKISEADLSEFKQWKFPESEDAACFATCVLQGVGVLDSEGILSHDSTVANAKEIFGSDEEIKKVEEFIATCKDIVDAGADKCARGKLVYRCIVDNRAKFHL